MTAKVYGCRLPDITYIFKDGSPATFDDAQDQFSTEDAEQQTELDAEIAAGHPSIYAVTTDAPAA